jgi:hypothetical protein
MKDYDIGNGICRYLKQDLCSIYKHRPNVCNVEWMYTNVFEKTITRSEYIELNLRSCVMLAENFGAVEISKKISMILEKYREKHHLLTPGISDHIPDELKDYFNKNTKRALENMDKAAKEFLVRFYHA